MTNANGWMFYRRMESLDKIEILDIIDEDFVNYKVPSMTIMCPNCTFKCGKENCQNYHLRNQTRITVSPKTLYDRYSKNMITRAIVFQGFEPFDSFEEMESVIKYFRDKDCEDDIVIYTGYNRDEIHEIDRLSATYKNLVIKFGRYIPNMSSHYDETLGVYLASDNQYAEKIS